MDIYVGNLPYQADDQKLQELFAQHGTVNSARVIVDKFSGESKGFGFVEMPQQADAEAVAPGGIAFDETVLDQRRQDAMRGRRM